MKHRILKLSVWDGATQGVPSILLVIFTLILAGCGTAPAPILSEQYLYAAEGSAQPADASEEELSLQGSPQVINDSDTKNGAYRFIRNGDEISWGLGRFEPGEYEVRIRARAQLYQGPPRLELKLPGFTKTLAVSSESYEVLSFGRVLLTEGGKLSLTFTNDRYGGPGKDRNVIVDYIYLKRLGDMPGVAPLQKPDDFPKVTLPVEVYGEDNYVKKVTFWLEDAPENAQLHLKTHRLAYRDASTNPGRGAKGSVRINGGPWVELHNGNSDLACYEHEAAYGCLNAAYHTVRFSVKVPGAKPGENILEFRFNGTDGFTNGYRVLSLNLRSGGQGLISSVDFAQEDPAAWAPPSPDQDNTSTGRWLWNNATLSESPLSNTKLRASCADCHAADGRDLKYFNYSNTSIIERSKFHGLSDLQGRQIASYIRSRQTPAPSQARPWNPPYQPGPGMDSRPVEEWAAGAGLRWVLEEDEDMLPHLFPEGTSRAALGKVMDTKATLNTREIPISLQLPDWNEWLPEVHPKDAFGPLFEQGVSSDAHPLQAYLDLREGLNTAEGRTRLYRARDISATTNHLKRFLQEDSNEANPLRVQDGMAMAAAHARRPSGMSTRQAGERARQGLAKWNATKRWELHQTFGLEDVATEMSYPAPEIRNWLGNNTTFYNLAPHFLTLKDQDFRLMYQDNLVADYQSSAWYQVELTLHPGMRQFAQPHDWPYQQNFILRLGQLTGEHQPLRFLHTNIKAYQQRDTGQGGLRGGWMLRVTHPLWLYADPKDTGDTSHMRLLNSYEPGLRDRVVDVMLEAWLEHVEPLTEDDWARCTTTRQNPELWYCLAPRGSAPAGYPKSGSVFRGTENSHHTNLYRLIPCLREQGVDESLVRRLVAWGDRMWPDARAGSQDWFGVNTLSCPDSVRP